MLLIIFAFLSGLATIVSPCVLPVLPVILSTSTGAGRMRPVGVVLGLVGSFSIATLVGAAAAQSIALPSSWLRAIAILALGIFGLSMLVPAWGRVMERALSPLTRLGGGTNRQSGLGGGLIMGAGLGLLWAPCVGPIMASVIALAVSRGISADLASITLAYAVGAGVPLLVIAYGARRFMAGARSLAPRAELVRRVLGGLTVLACLALLFGLESRIQNLVPTSLNAALTGFESQQSVQKELDKLEVKAQTTNDLSAAAAPQAGGTSQAPTNGADTQPNVPPTEMTQPTSTSAPPTAVPVPPTATAAKPDPGIALQDLGPAPELVGLSEWINSKPLTLKSLRGKVVIVDFWTFACYNCANTRPYVQALYKKYHDQGLEILGIHTPELSFERVPENVRAAVKEQKIDWPVAIDPDFKTWNAYSNRYWPAFYFIDAKGHLRYTHFGEGNYDYHDKVVQQLLSETHAASR